MTELYKLVYELCKLDVTKISFSVPCVKDSDIKKCVARVLDGKKVQFETFTVTQAFHENVPFDGLCDKAVDLLTNSFRQAEVFTDAYIYGIKISSKGKVLHNKHKNDSVKKENITHNKEKNYIITLENMPPVFRDIGIVGGDGKIVNGKFDKYRQICRFVEFIDDVVKKDPREEYFIVDFGCGKSYLTFICYHYMTSIMGKKVSMVGLDLKKQVIEDCNNLCKKYGYDDIKFLCMDIKDYNPERRPDMVIALHACDVATDYALYNAYRWQSDYIFSAPCCQHELNSKIKTDSFGLLCDYGLIKERISALATDAVRGKILEACGYNVDVLEFVDAEFSPKNILIRASRSTKVNSIKRKIILDNVAKFTDEFNAELTLEKLVFGSNAIYSCSGKDFSIVCGKASMLLKDAMKVRAEVFGNEQGYKKGAERDKLDDTAWFVNVYDNNIPVATSRMVFADKVNERLLGKIAVLPEYRKYGIGKVMLNCLEKIAAEEKVCTLNIIAQKQALGFYEKLGYSVCGNEFSDENIPMCPVKKDITKPEAYASDSKGQF